MGAGADRTVPGPPGALTLGCSPGPASEAPSPSPHRHGDTPGHTGPAPPGPGSPRGRPHPAHARPSLPHAPVGMAPPLTGCSVVRALTRAPRLRGLILGQKQLPAPSTLCRRQPMNVSLFLSLPLPPPLPLSLHSTLSTNHWGRHPWMKINKKWKGHRLPPRLSPVPGRTASLVSGRPLAAGSEPQVSWLPCCIHRSLGAGCGPGQAFPAPPRTAHGPRRHTHPQRREQHPLGAGRTPLLWSPTGCSGLAGASPSRRLHGGSATEAPRGDGWFPGRLLLGVAVPRPG